MGRLLGCLILNETLTVEIEYRTIGFFSGIFIIEVAEACKVDLCTTKTENFCSTRKLIQESELVFLVL